MRLPLILIMAATAHARLRPLKSDDHGKISAPTRSSWEFTATLTLPPDTGQALGTFFEISDQAGHVVAHAGGVLAEGTYLNNQNRHFVFHVASQQRQTPDWKDLGKPFPESCCETRCASINGSLYVFNRNLPAADKNTATLSADGSWARAVPPPWLAGGSAVETCGGILTLDETEISFSGRTIYSLNTTKFGYMSASFVSGKILMYAMSQCRNASQCIASQVRNQIMIGHWACDANQPVKIVASYDDPTPLANQWHNTPYAWLATTADASHFLIGANLGDVYLVNETSFTRVHDSIWPVSGPGQVSWQPYTMITVGKQILMGQYPTGGVFSWSNDSLTFPKNNVGVEPGAGTLSREAMTLAIYGDDVLLGMWPWGSLFGRNARDEDGEWSFRKRVFTAPPVTKEEAPWMTYIEKSYPENSTWHPNGAGQRIEGTCLHNGSIYFTTSAKNHVDYGAVAKIIPERGFEEYGRVWQMSVPNQVSSGSFVWRPGTTTLSFKVDTAGISVTQDGEPLASKAFGTPFELPAGPFTAKTCSGIFGECASGVKIHVALKTDDTTAPDPISSRKFDDWHYPIEEHTESAALVTVGASQIDVDSGSATVYSGGNETRCHTGDTVFGSWRVLEVMQADDGAAMVVIEHRAARWGVLSYVTLDGERARLRTSIGRVSELAPLAQRAFNFSAAEPDYWRRAREDPGDFIGSRILAEGNGEPDFSTAAKYMAAARDNTLIGTPDSTMAWVIAPDGRIRRGDAVAQAQPDDESAPLPNSSLLIFDPKNVLLHWPQRFTSYKSSLLDGWGRAGHVGAWDAEARKGFELLAVAPNRTMDAQLLIRVGEADCSGDKGSCDIPSYQYFRAGDHGPDLLVVDAYHSSEPDGKRFYQMLLSEHELWNGPLFFSRDTAMSIRLPTAERRVSDMARASLTMGLTLYRGLVPNYGTFPVQSTQPLRL